jgi:hypothetical protein
MSANVFDLPTNATWVILKKGGFSKVALVPK